MSPPCFVSPFIKKLLENFLLGSWSFFHFIFYIFPHTSFVSLSIAIFSYFLRQIIARDCRRKLPSCPFHLKTMDSLPLSQNKKPFPLLIRWNSSENIRRTYPNQVLVLNENILFSSKVFSLQIPNFPFTSPSLHHYVACYSAPKSVWNNYNYLCWGQLWLHL